jgi:predicted RNA-binding Zn-ribbon protein involved in translation (DUF1610 family)
MVLTTKEKSLKQWEKNKANAYPCPECGKIINKSTVYRHKESYFHKYNALLNANKQEPVVTTT